MSGGRREQMKRKEGTQKADTIYKNRQLKFRNQMKNYKNSTNTLNQKTVQQILTENNKENRLDDEALLAIKTIKFDQDYCLPGKKISGIIQQISCLPACCILFSEAGLKVYKKYAKSIGKTLHIDATGGLIKPYRTDFVRDQKKEFLQYTILMKNPVDKKTPFPLANMITDKHDATQGITWLIHVKQGLFQIGLKQKNGNVLWIVIDFSWMLLHSSLLVFNGEYIERHIMVCYEIIEGKWDRKNILNRTYIIFCAAHIIKNFSEKLKELKVHPDIARFYKKKLAMVQTSTDYQLIQEIMRKIFILLKANNESNLTEQTTEELSAMYSTHMSEELSIYEESEDLTEKPREFYGDTGPEKAMKQNSLFNKDFEAISQSVDKDIDKSGSNEKKPNKYRCLKFYKYLRNTYLPLLPLWTGIMMRPERYSKDAKKVDLTSNIPTHKTNALVECHFKNIKEDPLIRPKLKRWRFDEYVQRLSHLYQRFKSTYNTEAERGSKKPGKIDNDQVQASSDTFSDIDEGYNFGDPNDVQDSSANEEDFATSQETWGKRKKRSSKPMYFPSSKKMKRDNINTQKKQSRNSTNTLDEEEILVDSDQINGETNNCQNQQNNNQYNTQYNDEADSKQHSNNQDDTAKDSNQRANNHDSDRNNNNTQDKNTHDGNQDESNQPSNNQDNNSEDNNQDNITEDNTEDHTNQSNNNQDKNTHDGNQDESNQPSNNQDNNTEDNNQDNITEDNTEDHTNQSNNNQDNNTQGNNQDQTTDGDNINPGGSQGSERFTEGELNQINFEFKLQDNTIINLPKHIRAHDGKEYIITDPKKETRGFNIRLVKTFYGDIDVTLLCLASLWPGECVVDTIIEAFLVRLAKRAFVAHKVKTYVFDTKFWMRLERMEDKETQLNASVARQINLFQLDKYDMWLVPELRGSHFVLIVITFRNIPSGIKIYYLDGLKRTDGRRSWTAAESFKTLEEKKLKWWVYFLRRVSMNARKMLEIENIRIQIPHDIRTQNNSNSCGAYTAVFGHTVLTDLNLPDMNWNDTIIDQFRRIMIDDMCKDDDLDATGIHELMFPGHIARRTNSGFGVPDMVAGPEESENSGDKTPRINVKRLVEKENKNIPTRLLLKGILGDLKVGQHIFDDGGPDL